MLGIAKTIAKSQMQTQLISSYQAISPAQAKTLITNLNLVQSLENALFLVIESAAINNAGIDQKNQHSLQKKQNGKNERTSKVSRADRYKLDEFKGDLEAPPKKLEKPPKPVGKHHLKLMEKELRVKIDCENGDQVE